MECTERMRGQERIMRMGLLTEHMVWMQAIGGLVVLAGILLIILYYMRYHTLKLYNWDGKRYCFLGRILLRKRNDTYVVKIREHIWDISYTTRYLLVPSRQFVQTNRNRSLLLQAGQAKEWLSVDAGMRQDIYCR